MVTSRQNFRLVQGLFKWLPAFSPLPKLISTLHRLNFYFLMASILSSTKVSSLDESKISSFEEVLVSHYRSSISQFRKTSQSTLYHQTKSLDTSKLKVVADVKLDATQRFKFWKGRNIVGKGENNGNQHSSFLQNVFKGFYSQGC